MAGLGNITPEELAAQQANLGVPNLAAGQVVLPMNPDAAPVSGPIQLAGQPAEPQMAEQPLLGQAPTPPLVDPATAKVTQQPKADLDLPPAGPQTVSTTDKHTSYQAGVKLDPASIAENKAKQADASAAIAKSAEIEAGAQAKIADAEAERARKLENERLVQENAAEQRRLKEAAVLQKIIDAQKEVEAVQPVPEDSTFDKVRKAIAIAMSQFGAALTGGKNGALEVIEADRAQKMQSWKAAYERAKGKVSNEQNMYAMLRQRGLDDKEAEIGAIRLLNGQYDAMVKQIAAGSRAPVTIEQSKVAQARLAQDNLADEAKLQSIIQPKIATVTDQKSVTKEGGDPKIQGDVLKLKNDDVDDYKAKAKFLSRYNNLRDAGADGAALAAFIAGKDGLNQGSYGESFAKMLKKYSWLGGSIESVREKLQGGVDPEFLKEIGVALALDSKRAETVAGPAIKQFQRLYQQNGLDPRMVLGGEPSADAAASVGAAPAAYQGRK